MWGEWGREGNNIKGYECYDWSRVTFTLAHSSFSPATLRALIKVETRDSDGTSKVHEERQPLLTNTNTPKCELQQMKSTVQTVVWALRLLAPMLSAIKFRTLQAFWRTAKASDG